MDRAILTHSRRFEGGSGDENPSVNLQLPPPTPSLHPSGPERGLGKVQPADQSWLWNQKRQKGLYKKKWHHPPEKMN